MNISRRQKIVFLDAVLAALGMLMLVFFAALAGIHWQIDASFRRQVDISTESVAGRMRLRLEGNADYIAMLAEERGEGKLDAGTFVQLATAYVVSHPEFINIIWVSANGETDAAMEYIAPGKGNAQNIVLPLQLPAAIQAAHAAQQTRKPVYSAAFEASPGNAAFALWAPVFTGNVNRGWFVGVYSCTELLQNLVSDDLKKLYYAELLDAQARPVCSPPALRKIETDMQHQSNLMGGEHPLTVSLRRYGRGNIGKLLLAIEIICALLILGIVYALSRLRRERRVRHDAEESLQVVESVFEHCFDAVIIIDAERKIVDVNPAYSRMFGYDKADVIGKAAGHSLTARSRAQIERMLERTLATRVDWQLEIQGERKNGEVHDGMLSLSYVCDTAGEVRYAVAVIVDISTLKQHEAKLERTAHYDALTGLPNRLLMTQHVEAATLAATEADPVAVCYLDIDDFQSVNDDYGQDIGDQVLIEIAKRLESCANAVGHIGGDEFVLLYHSINNADTCYELLDGMLANVRAPIAVAGFSLKVSISIGVTFYPHDDSSADSLMRHANQAMHMAKDGGKNRIHLFDAEHARRARNRRDVLAQLRLALDNNEFVLFYQPKVDVVDRRVVGAEALIRWQHPERGLVPPAEFLPYLEGSDLEISVGEWVIETALKQIETWLNAEAICVPVSVNISPKHLLTPDFAERLQLAVSRYAGLPEHSLELEIVENAALGDINAAIAVLTACKRLGVGFALDDFGTGYSSLSYFQRLPVDVLKIDQSFVRNMHENPADREIVESVIKLAQVFHRAVIAEGVESAEHAALLQKIGCRFMQGYGIARPMPAEQLLNWIKLWESDKMRRSISAF